MYDELRELDQLIRRKKEMIAELRALATSLSAPMGLRVQTSHEDRLSNLMCKIIIAENELEEMIYDYKLSRKRAKEEIEQLRNEEWKEIMYLHYIEFIPIEDIASRKGKSVGSVYMKNNRAKKCLKKLNHS